MILHLQSFYNVRDELTALSDSCIVRDNHADIPEGLHCQPLSLAHEGHQGIVKLKNKCCETIWWPGIDKEIEYFVCDCTASSISGKSVKPIILTMTSISLPSSP